MEACTNPIDPSENTKISRELLQFDYKRLLDEGLAPCRPDNEFRTLKSIKIGYDIYHYYG